MHELINVYIKLSQQAFRPKSNILSHNFLVNPCPQLLTVHACMVKRMEGDYLDGNETRNSNMSKILE